MLNKKIVNKCSQSNIAFYISLYVLMLMISVADYRHIINTSLIFIIIFVILKKSKFNPITANINNKLITIISFYITISFVAGMYIKYRNDIGILFNISKTINVSVNCLAITISIICGFISFLSILVIVNQLYILFDLERIRKKLNFYKIPIFIFFIFLLLCNISLIRSNYLFHDDNIRVFSGMIGWDNFSRYISYYLSMILHTNVYLADISPFNQILAIFVASISCLVLLYVIYGEKKYTFVEYISVTPIVLTPYFLSCLSYRYDALYMSLSLLFSLIPMIYIKINYEKKRTIAIVALCTICMLSCYQSSSGIFPIVFIFYLIDMYIFHNADLKTICHNILTSLLGYLLGCITYMLFLMRNQDSYVSTKIAGLGNLFSTAMNNVLQYYKLMISDFNSIWMTIVIALLVMYVYSLIRKDKKVIKIILMLLMISFSLLISFGIYIVLEKPLFSPRAMIGIGAFISLLSAYSLKYTNKTTTSIILVLSMFIVFTSFSFIYGNMIHYQDEYTKNKINVIINELNDIDTNKDVVICGDGGFSPIVRETNEYYPVLSRMLEGTTLSSSSVHIFYKLNHHYDIKFNMSSEDNISKESRLIKKKMYFDIYEDSNAFYFVLK